MVTKLMSKKRKFVADGLLHAELNEFFELHLSEKGYSGCEVRTTPSRTEIVLRATSTNDIVGQDGRNMNELTELVRKRFNFEQDKIAMFAEAVPVRGLCAIAQAENLKFKLVSGLAVRRAAYGVMRQVMGAGACGCEVVISGKLRGARAKSMKFNDGFMTHSGDPIKRFIVRAVRNVELRQGVLGIKVKIMLPHDPTGRRGPSLPLPDMVVIHDPKEEDQPIVAPRTEFVFRTPKTQPQTVSNAGAHMPPQDVRHLQQEAMAGLANPSMTAEEHSSGAVYSAAGI